MLEYTLKKSLKDRRQELTFAEKVVWLDSFEDMGNGDYNITFKSAKYNHVRNEINTETMEPLGTRKQRRDGDEEKTHLCIRLAQGQQRYLGYFIMILFFCFLIKSFKAFVQVVYDTIYCDAVIITFMHCQVALLPLC